ncbi:hypothetical protein [Virgibacillus salexigens]|uniref:Uncharacterized protein n=1 Tax=Virgibacillus massiliensis TaxID=1462526 RepID=A0A024QHB0_9BACI|nr:hypothetical protein [Virgibacillus massiliensis]CDQ41884.1 hypothetical protein BN990_04263 [Virgibacillus massiliensis]
MDKRLEEIIAVVNSQSRSTRELSHNDMNWLIQRAKREEKLDKLSEELNHDLFSERMEKDKYQYRSEIQKERIKELEQAIEKAIGGCRYTKPEVAYILSQALKGEANG